MPSPPSRQEHSLWLAQVIVQTMVAAAQSCITIADYRRVSLMLADAAGVLSQTSPQ